MSFLTGYLFGALSGVVLTVGVEVTVACAAYAAYRTALRMGWIREEGV